MVLLSVRICLNIMPESVTLKKGEYEKAIDYLEDFSSNDQIIGPMATMAIGDAYMELKQTDKAIDYYLEGADKKKMNLQHPSF